MQRAGLATAKLAIAIAIAPHAQHIWLACGPGNNGGDGMEAAVHLKQWGKEPVITWLGTPEQAPADARASFQRAMLAGVTLSTQIPDHVDLCIDALLGLGSTRQEPHEAMATWIDQMNRLGVPVLAVDLPSGLDTSTGATTHTSELPTRSAC